MTEPTPEATAHEEMLVRFLAEGGEELTHGEALAQKLGLTRADVFRHIESLRARGYLIDAVRGGYRLRAAPDRLTSLELGPLLDTHDFGQTILHYASVDSTNARALDLAEEGALHGETVIAEEQTKGRGRRGRTWASPKGVNIYLSVVLRPALTAERAAELTLVAAVAVAEVVRELGVEARIHWPNDILVGRRKLAGILCEMATRQDGSVRFAVLGVGINVNARLEDFPDEVRPLATSVAMELGRKVDRAVLCARLLGKLEEWYDRHGEEGLAPVLARWRALSGTLGARVSVQLDGEREVTGIAVDLDDSGALLLRDAQGTVHRVVSGEVRRLAPA